MQTQKKIDCDRLTGPIQNTGGAKSQVMMVGLLQVLLQVLWCRLNSPSTPMRYREFLSLSLHLWLPNTHTFNHKHTHTHKCTHTHTDAHRRAQSLTDANSRTVTVSLISSLIATAKKKQSNFFIKIASLNLLSK